MVYYIQHQVQGSRQNQALAALPAGERDFCTFVKFNTNFLLDTYLFITAATSFGLNCWLSSGRLLHPVQLMFQFT